jgi:CHAT domain-containing protein/Tfp pilus assembly protein PilF
MPDASAMSRWEDATAAYRAGNSRLALERLDEALAAAPGADAKMRSYMLYQKAEWACESGHSEQAEAALNEAILLVEQMPTEGHEDDWAGLRSTQAYLARARGDLAAAEAFYSDAAALAARSPARDLLLPDVYANQAAVYMDQGKLGDAQEILVTALEIDRRVGNKRSESNDLNVLGLVAKRRGDADTAKVYFLKAFSVAHESGFVREAMDAITNFSAYLDDAGDHEKAAELFRESGALLADVGDEARLACAIANQGAAMAKAGDLNGAVAYLTRSRELHLATGNQLHAVGDLINLSSAEAGLGHHDQALAHAKEALRSAEEFGLIEKLWQAEYQVATCRGILATERLRRLWEAGSSSPEEALKDPATEDNTFDQVKPGYRRAIDYIELLRSNVDHPDERHTMLTGKEQVYGAAIAFCLSFRDGGWEALELSERARMRSFLDALGSSRTEQLESADPAAGWRAELVARLLDPGTPPADKPGLMDELRTVRAEMMARQPAVAAITGAELPTTEDILAAIPSDTAMLVYYQLDEQVIIFPLLPGAGDGAGELQFVRVNFGEPVEGVVRKLRREIERGDTDLPTGNALFAALFRPVMPLLATTQNLIIVPHGALHYLPFSALWFVPAGDDTPPREYLRTRFIQTTVPSASYLPFLARVSGGERTYGPPVVLGNPTGDLPGAEQEAQNVAAILGVPPRLGAAATRDALLSAGSPSVLHVASHGVYDTTDPLLSRLEMANGGVTVEDLLAVGPAPGVLVLSGCVTGLSDRKPGDELIGLAQAMLRRGTRAVVATLWETFDESSALFFEHFYQALISEAPVNEAMTIARHYLATGPGGFDQPVDWAPFVLIGDPGHRVVDPADPLRLAYNHGVELEERGDLAGALREFRKAADSPNPVVASRSAYHVGTVLGRGKDITGALAAFRAAAESGDPQVTGMADYRVGQILADSNDTDGALAAYQRAMNSADPDAQALAALDVGGILFGRGDLPGARAAYQRAIDGDQSEASPKAAYNLGVLLQKTGDIAGAVVAYRRAMDSGLEEIAPTAAVALSAMLATQGEADAARVALQQAIDSGDRNARPLAAYNLGLLLMNQQDLDGARASLAIAAESGNRDIARSAAELLARLKRAAKRPGRRLFGR